MGRVGLAAAVLVLPTEASWAQAAAGKTRPSVEVDLSVLDELPPMQEKPAGEPIVLRPPGAAKPKAAETAGAPPATMPAKPMPAPAKRPGPDAGAKSSPTRPSPPVAPAASSVAPAREIAAVSAPAPRQEPAAASRPEAAAESRPEAAAVPPPATTGEESASEARRTEEQPAPIAGPTASPPAAAEMPERPMTAPLPPTAEPPAENIAEEQSAALQRTSPAAPPSEPAMFRIPFAAEATDLSDEDNEDLATVIDRMKKDGDLRVVIYAYASGTADAASKARRVSFSRALSLRRYLVSQGIPGTRAEIRALGSKTDEEPADRVDLVLVKR